MIGIRIRELRQARRMTIKDLAAAADVSTGLISQVERGLADPSLETLRRFARVFDLPLFDLFRQDEPAAVAVVRGDRRMLVSSPHGGVAYSRISPGAGRLELLEGTLAPQVASSARPWSHPSEECLVVVSGRLVVEVADERYLLAPGDSCYFDSRLPHRYLNETDEPARFLIAVTPPSH